MVDFTELFTILSAIGVLVAVVSNIYSIKSYREERVQDRENDAVWRKGIEDTLNNLGEKVETLTDRVDSHNNYAKMFADCTNDISYIKGQIKSGRRWHR